MMFTAHINPLLYECKYMGYNRQFNPMQSKVIYDLTILSKVNYHTHLFTLFSIGWCSCPDNPMHSSPMGEVPTTIALKATPLLNISLKLNLSREFSSTITYPMRVGNLLIHELLKACMDIITSTQFYHDNITLLYFSQ